MKDYLEFKDYLCFSSDNDVKSIIRDEQLIFSDKVTKKAIIGINKIRNILLTNKALYDLDDKSKLNS